MTDKSGPEGCSSRELKKFGVRVVDRQPRFPTPRFECAVCSATVKAPYRIRGWDGKYKFMDQDWWKCPNGCNQGGPKSE